MQSGSVLFAPDRKIARIAAAYAHDAVELSARSFGAKLDWTDASIARVESMLGHLRSSMPKPPPSEDVVWNFAKGFGSYVGEVFCKNHGGEWGTIKDGKNAFPGIRMSGGGETLFWPWDRVRKRLVEGDENNILTYYRTMVGEASGPRR